MGAAAAATGMVMLAALLASLAPAARGLDRGEFPPGFLFGAATSAYQVWLLWISAWRRLSLYLFVQFHCRVQRTVHQPSAVINSWFQIEGAHLEDGKGLSNWDVFTHTRRKFSLPETSLRVRCLSQD
jgi:beta-glucosidase